MIFKGNLQISRLFCIAMTRNHLDSGLINQKQVQRVVLTAELNSGGGCTELTDLDALLPSRGGTGSFTLSLLDPFTQREDTTDLLSFDASANEASAWT